MPEDERVPPPNWPRDERSPSPFEFATAAKDLKALRESVVDAAGISSGLWFSYLFVLLYLFVAIGGVTHRDLFFESEVKLPFLNVDLPLLGFFVLGPLMFLIVHTYVLLHFALLADKIGAFDEQLKKQVANHEIQNKLRRQLPSNIFVQVLAGPHEVRTGVMGLLLRLVAQISLVVSPIGLLVFFQLQFLPFHSEWISWWQRVAVVIDLSVLWMLWPSIARGRAAQISWDDFKRKNVAALAALSITPILLVFGVATFQGEWLDGNATSARVIPWWNGDDPWAPHSTFTSLHELLVAGSIDFVTGKPRSLWSNILVLPNIDLRADPRFDSKADIDTASGTVSLRGRHLEGVILIGAQLPKADFTSAQMQRANLSGADLRGARFSCAKSQIELVLDASSGERCAQLQGAILSGADLRGANLVGGQFQYAMFGHTDLQGAWLQYAAFDSATFLHAKLDGARLDETELPAAVLTEASLRGALLRNVNLKLAHLEFANLDGAVLEETDIRGAMFNGASFVGTLFHTICAWRTAAPLPAATVNGAQFTNIITSLNATDLCNWSAESYSHLKQRLAKMSSLHSHIFVEPDELKFLPALDPVNPLKGENSMAESWSALVRSSPTADAFWQTHWKVISKIGCNPVGAPYVLHGLIPSLIELPMSQKTRIGELANAFLNESICPGAKGLSEVDRRQLEELANQASVDMPIRIKRADLVK